MSKVAFFIPAAAGAMHASYGLAKELIAGGHEVCYVGAPDCEAYVRGNGLEFREIFARWFPKGFFAAASTLPPDTVLRKISYLRKSTAYLQRFMEALRNEGRDEFQTLMEDIRPDLCLIGSAYLESTIWGLLAHGLHLRAAYMNSTFIRSADRSVPPVWTAIVPDGSFLSSQRIRLAWSMILWRKRIAESIKARFGLGLDWAEEFAQLAVACGYPPHLLTFDHAISPRLHLPELVLWSREFDFPQTDRPNRFYVGPLIDYSRPQAAFPWERVAAGKKLIYCSLGSLPFLNAMQYRTFYQRVVKAAAMRPQWQWIIAIGDSVNAAGLEPIPENALVVKWAPQLAILERADIAITHAGANSVKECISYGVPMLLFPLGLDHPGTAVRAALHGLALVGNPHRVSAGRIVALLEKIDQSPDFRGRAALLREQFRRADESATACHIVRTILETQPDGVRSHSRKA